MEGGVMADEFDPIDYGDLVAVVQPLREIGWRGSLGPAKMSVTKHRWPWFEDVDEFDGYLAALRDRAESNDAEVQEECAILIAEAERVFTALRSNLPRPDPDDVIARFVGGEIGDRTAQYVMNWDVWQLHEECAKRNLPPMQMVSEDEEAEKAAVDRLTGILRQNGFGNG
jgi:hypothetical protein